MTHVVTSNCKGCQFTDCVLVCPVDCFYDTGTQLVIDPDECIDCSACVAECPVEAIYAEDELFAEDEDAITFNADSVEDIKSNGGEAVTDQREPLPTAEDRRRQLGF